MARKKFTIRHYVHTDEFKEKLREVERDLEGMGYRELWRDGLDRAPKGSDVYDIYCWRWHGYWSGGAREFFRRYYRPAAS